MASHLVTKSNKEISFKRLLPSNNVVRFLYNIRGSATSMLDVRTANNIVFLEKDTTSD